jgi:hypothetical protein
MPGSAALPSRNSGSLSRLALRKPVIRIATGGSTGDRWGRVVTMLRPQDSRPGGGRCPGEAFDSEAVPQPVCCTLDSATFHAASYGLSLKNLATSVVERPPESPSTRRCSTCTDHCRAEH